MQFNFDYQITISVIYANIKKLNTWDNTKTGKIIRTKNNCQCERFTLDLQFNKLLAYL